MCYVAYFLGMPSAESSLIEAGYLPGLDHLSHTPPRARLARTSWQGR